MSTCKHKWKKEPFAGSVKCIKCGHVEFDVAGECLSLQAKVEEMQAAIAEFYKWWEGYGRLNMSGITFINGKLVAIREQCQIMNDKLLKFLPEKER